MKNKNGFTLVELLAVIALIAVLSIIAVPNILKMFNKSTEETMTVQENQVLDAANLFIRDFCTRPLASTRGQCSDNVFKAKNNKRFVCTTTLQEKEVVTAAGSSGSPYLGKIYFKGNVPCKGFVIYDVEDEYSTYQHGKTYLQCKDNSYVTEGINNFEVEGSNQKVLAYCGGE